MFSLRPLLKIAAVFVAGFIAFVWISGITKHDIYAYHNFEFATPNKLISPGAIVAVSNKGRISEICALRVEDSEMTAPEKAIYYNRLREDFPSYVRSIQVVTYLFGSPEADREAMEATIAKLPSSGRAFQGSEVAVANLMMANEFLEDDCERNMAWHMSKGYRACTVRKVLNEHYIAQDGSIQQRTVAVALAEHSNIVKKSTFEEHGIAYTEQVAEFNGSPCDGDTLTIAAKIRRAIDAIDRYNPEVVGSL